MKEFFQDIDLIKRRSVSDDYRKITIPNFQRHKTDIYCSIAYYLLTLFLLGVAFYSFITEQDRKFWQMKDSDGTLCGRGKAQEYNYLYYPNPLGGYQGLQKKICVKGCPVNQDSKIECLKNSMVSQCPNNQQVYATSQIELLRICEPVKSVLEESFENLVNIHAKFFDSIENLYDAKYIIAFMCPFVSLIMVVVFISISTNLQQFRYFYAFVTFGTMFMCLYISYYLFELGHRYPQNNLLCTIIAIMLICGVIIASSMLIYSVVCGNNVFNRLVLLRFASLYLRQNLAIIAMQFSAFLIWTLTFILWITIVIWIYLITEPNKDKYALINLEHSPFVTIVLFLAIFHFVWTNLIIYSVFSYITYASSSNWILRFPNYLNLALYRALKYHFGTIVFGALIFPISSWLSDLLFLLMPSHEGVCFCCVFKPWLNFYSSFFFRNFLSVFSQKNYISTNLLGQGFCRSGRTLSPILVQNISSVQYSYKVAKAFVISARFLMAFITTVICSVTMLFFEISRHTFTLIVIFMVCLILASFVSSSYEKTYESILITVFLADDRMKKMQQKGYYLQYLINAFTLHKQNPLQVFTAVEQWFKTEVEEQKSMKVMV